MNLDYLAIGLSVVATLVAAFAAFVGYAGYRTQADPEVIVYAESDLQRAGIINLVIENIGRAPARRVSFETAADLPAKVGLRVSEAGLPQKMTEGPLVRGIPFLPPGGKRVVTWGLYRDLKDALGSESILVVSTYSGRHIGIPWPIRLKTSCQLEVFSFEATDASDRNFSKQIADNIKGLRQAVDGVASRLSGTE
jgi:hypothetical protein